MKLREREISRVAVIDDDYRVRDSLSYSLEDAGLKAVSEGGPLPDLDAYAPLIRKKADAAICDWQLRTGTYAEFNGAELVARCYENEFPAILATRWEQAQLDQIRPYRDRIPVLLKPEEASDPEVIVNSIETCLDEFDNGPPSWRKAWRTQVRVVEVDEAADVFFVEIPAWANEEIVRLSSSSVDTPEVLEHLLPDARFHASVNLGSELVEELFFRDWELG